MSLSIKKMKQVHNLFLFAANQSGVSFCLIGGASFAARRIKGYKTEDIDFAALWDLDDDWVFMHVPEISRWPNPTSFSWNENGHYMVGLKNEKTNTTDGYKVDWIHKLSDGTKRLFELAVAHRELVDGMWVAPLDYAVAIRAAAGRDKDRRLFRRFVKNGVISAKKVYKILKKFAPESPGFEWVEKYTKGLCK